MEPQEPTDNQVALQAAANSQPRGSVMELLPGQDTELRKEYLHRMYVCVDECEWSRCGS